MKINHWVKVLCICGPQKFLQNYQQKIMSSQKGFLGRERMKYIVLKEEENVPSSNPEKEMVAFGDWLAKHQKYCHLSETTKFKQP